MNPISLFRALVLLGLLFGIQSASAAVVNWGSNRLATNYTSDLQALGQAGQFTFEVGAFQPGFVPSAANIDQWEANWIAADGTAYRADFAFAAGSAQRVETIPAGAQGYIWGFDSRAEGAVEWILVTDSSWVWSAAGGVEQPVDWTVGTAGQVVVGEVGASGAAFHMQTAALELGGALSAEAGAWLAEYFSGELDSADAGWMADPDKDGVPNAIEFAFGTSPHASDEAVAGHAGTVRESGLRYLTVTFDAQPNAAAGLAVEVSDDLQNWSPAGASVEINISAGQVELRDTLPLGGGRRFLRLSVAP